MNKLSNEKSEYLLQHSNNPVNWFPWGKEAFDKAKLEDKPIFLSIGYSSCHWCHVMEKESFEDIETAKILNQNFISIKVDREERPDIDSIYMASIQMISGGGGWPASIFMNSEGVPFYAGTYFPKFDRHNIPAFRSVLAKIIEIYQTNRKSVNEHSSVVYDGLKSFFDNISKNEIALNNLYPKIQKQIKDTFDYEKGGFGNFPKFPETSKLEILFMLGKKLRSNEYYDMGQLTLGSMINGGVFDQLSGGFSRYSTDRDWKVPHFEKMLYDNALILNILCFSFMITKNKQIRKALDQTVDFLEKEMKSEENLFYSTQDADSEGKEGEYYTWSFEELENIFSKDIFEIIKDYWNITKDGDLDKKNILYVTKSLRDISEAKNISEKELESTIQSSKEKLINIRNKRIRPNTDKKYISSWNSLLLSSLCSTYNVTGDYKFLNQAIDTAKSILQNFKKNNNLTHTATGDIGFLEDYSYLTKGLFDLYHSSQDSKWYYLAKDLCDDTINQFWSKKDKIFYDTAESNDLIIRPKGFFDPMIPNSAAIAAQNSYKCYRFTNDEKYLKIVGESMKSVSNLIDKSPLDLPSWFKLYYLMEEQNTEIFISGDTRESFYTDSLRTLLSSYMPTTIIISKDTNNPDFYLPIMEGRNQDKKNKVYVCQNYICDLPIDNLDSLKKKINELSGAYLSK